MIELVGLSVQI